MVLIDFSQTCLANLYQQINKEKTEVEPNLLRHMIFNSVRKLNKEFGSKYGRLVICADSHNYWRKNYFPEYKANRKKNRDPRIDWNMVFSVMDSVRDDLQKYFPYKVMSVPLTEADDIIGVLAKTYHSSENILIISRDEDFLQLQRYPNVKQYAPTKSEYLKTDDPAACLKEHIIRGDEGDGVPNFLSQDDVFLVDGIRQKSIFQKKLAVWLTQQPEEFCDETTIKNYRRNEKMVDLTQIPPEIQAAILEEYARPIEGDKSKIYGYFIKKQMRNMLELVRDF